MTFPYGAAQPAQNPGGMPAPVNSQVAQQPGPHPTVPYGQPQPQQQGQPVYGPNGLQYVQPQQMQQQPQMQQQHPTAPYGQQVQQSQGYPQMQQPMQQQPQQPQAQMQQSGSTAQLDDNTIIQGPGWPAEVQGRRFGDVKRIFAALNEHYQRTAGPPQQQPNGRPQQQQPAPQAQQPQAQQSGQSFWADPDGAIDRAIERRLAPVINQSVATEAERARQIAAQGVPDYNVIEGEVINIMSQAQAQQRTDPAMWANAMDLARGRLLSRGQYRAPTQQQQQAQGQQNGQGVQPTFGPGAAQPAYTPAYSFYTEPPTPPAPNGNQIQLTDDQRASAQRFGMTNEQYAAQMQGFTRG